MSITKIEDNLYLVDVETAGIKNFIASYILKGEKFAIIETGPTSSVLNIIYGLKELNVKPEEIAYVAVSHIHLDHGGGVGTLLKHLPKAEVIVHKKGAQHLANPEKLWQQSIDILGPIADIYGKPEPVPKERIIAAEDGMKFNIGANVELEAIETVGHASHHLCYQLRPNQGIFVGDAAGVYLSEVDAIVPTTPPPFRLDLALSSLDKLINLKPKALYYGHFGKASNAIERLQAYAKQLKLWADLAKQGIKNKESVDAIRNRIIAGDESLKEALKFIEEHPILRETTLRESVYGIIDYVSKQGVS
ncbi:MAG: MBL fold metallo-hydrolase [Candidatus Bathyarchaeia archaeon]